MTEHLPERQGEACHPGRGAEEVQAGGLQGPGPLDPRKSCGVAGDKSRGCSSLGPLPPPTP